MSPNSNSDNQLTEIIEWIHCSDCLRLTRHSVLAQHEKMSEGEPIAYCRPWWNTTYTLLMCCGCESATLRIHKDCSEWDDDYVEIEFYPTQIFRRPSRWRFEIPYEMHDLLSEIYAALHSNSYRLALMGARTMIDMFILDKIGDIGTFQQKLDALVDRGYLASQQKDILSVALEAGNAAVHRRYKPSSEVLNHVIDVVETLLQSYALEKASDSVKNKIPHRPRKNSMTDDNGTSTAI